MPQSMNSAPNVNEIVPLSSRSVDLYRKPTKRFADARRPARIVSDTPLGEYRVNVQFAKHTSNMPELYMDLMGSEELPLAPKATWKKLGAIYVFFHDGKPEHVGRTRNLQARIRGHLSDSHYSASFAFKQTRRQLNLVATYKPEGSRAALFAEEEFRAAFRNQSLRLRDMTMRFLAVECPVDQYLLELYTTLELGLNLDEFDTH